MNYTQSNRCRNWFISGLVLYFALLNGSSLGAKTIWVGSKFPTKNLSNSIAQISPGDTVHFEKGIYSGEQILKELKGTNRAWITFYASVADSVIIRGGTTAWQFTDPQYLQIEGFIFEEQTANGMNIDDGGDYSTSAHHVILKNCIFRNIKATGNNDLLKLSGLDDFQIIGCKFKKGSIGGSGIDMVGCHQGVIESCEFEDLGSNSIQAKGGSQHIRIACNKFTNGGQRAINLGGSTGMPFFRPIDARFEAANLEVFSNIFIGSDSPIAFVGCIHSKVTNNTIYKPGRWVVRILQENNNPQLIQCSKNTFCNNLIFYGNLRTESNVGANTLPETFRFANNLWFEYTATSHHKPEIPVEDSSQIFGLNPEWVDAEKGNFRLKHNSPAIGKANYPEEPISDYYHCFFKPLRSIGAVESGD